jgi:hypothetical protein
MPLSVEARGVQVSERCSDVILTAAHVPVELDEVGFQSFIGRVLDVPPTSIVTAKDLVDAREALGRWAWDWDGGLSTLAERCLQAIALGNFSLVGTADWPLPQFFPPHMLEELYFHSRRLPRHSRSRLAVGLAGRLDWAPPEGEANTEQTDLALILEHQLGIGQSPEVKPFSVRELVRNPRALVLAPIAAGSAGAVAGIGAAAMTGNWAFALLAAATGTGATILLGSGLWLADKLMAGVKHLEAAPAAKQLPGGRRRRQDPQE